MPYSDDPISLEKSDREDSKAMNSFIRILQLKFPIMISLPPQNFPIFPNRKQVPIAIIIHYVPYNRGMRFEGGGAFEIIIIFLPYFDGVVIG